METAHRATNIQFRVIVRDESDRKSRSIGLLGRKYSISELLTLIQNYLEGQED